MRKKILLIRLSSIGDIVLTSPIIRALSNQLNAELHFITKKAFNTVLAYHPKIKSLINYEDLTKEKISELSSEKFDLIIDLHNNLRSKNLIRQIGAKSITFDKINIRKWMFVQFKYPPLPEVHIVDRYFDAVKSLGIENDGKGLDFYIDPAVTNPILKENSPRIYIVIALGAAHKTKQIPEEKLCEIIEKTKDDLSIILIGGPAEAELGNRVAAKYVNVKNTAGKVSIHESAAIIRDAKLVLTPDTGMMHIAAALKKDIIVLWGNTVPEFGMYPYFGKEKSNFVNIEVSDLSCRPCSKIGHKACPKGHFKCMLAQDSSMIVEKIEQFIDNRN